MELILYACRVRLVSQFRQKKTQRFLMLAFGIVLAYFYSWLFSFVMLESHKTDAGPTPVLMLEYANLFILALIILKGFFPAYVPKIEIIQRIFPVRPVVKFRTELVVELVSPFYFILLNFLFFLWLMSPEYTFIYFLQSILVLLTAHVTLRSLQVFVERKVHWTSRHFSTAAVMAAVFVALQAQQPMFRPDTEDWLLLIAHLVALGFFIASNYFLELAAAEPRKRTVTYSQDSRRSLGWRLFKNHKLAKQMLVFGLVFKGFFLAIDAFSVTQKGSHIFDYAVTLWLFVGPIVIYSYVFNNIWGFYRNLWLTVERTSGSIKAFVKASLLPLWMPLLLDVILTLLYTAFFNHEHAAFIVSLYVSAVLILTPFGIIASIISPKAVKGGVFSFDAKASYLYNFIAIALFGMLFLPLLHPVLYLMYPLLLAGTYFAFFAVMKEYPVYKYKLFETLFKSNT
ncbi:hypothetical protein [Pontibacter arcticus]|uniref:Uncharacterized protein n=1 Tax=Pontibacter arcticus TaxID=2080288 RepID=A0A364RE07_9BACT|nr:hypothetical protein [Pontibacter arcticus]RAU82551.1 hypothetical protein DP923_12325 [Pontibacter arcticus]